MTIPTPQQFNDLATRIEELKQDEGLPESTVATENTLRRIAARNAPLIVGIATSQGGAHAINALVGLPSASAVLPNVGSAIGPWIAAAQVAYAADGIFGLYDIKDGTYYRCTCHKCRQNIQNIIDKKEMKTVHTAIGVATFGAWSIGKLVHSIAKSFQKGRPKEMTSRSLHESAQNGCAQAMATIFHLAGENKGLRGGDDGVMIRATSIIVSKDGWQELKKNW